MVNQGFSVHVITAKVEDIRMYKIKRLQDNGGLEEQTSPATRSFIGGGDGDCM